MGERSRPGSSHRSPVRDPGRPLFHPGRNERPLGQKIWFLTDHLHSMKTQVAAPALMIYTLSSLAIRGIPETRQIASKPVGLRAHPVAVDKKYCALALNEAANTKTFCHQCYSTTRRISSSTGAKQPVPSRTDRRRGDHSVVGTRPSGNAQPTSIQDPLSGLRSCQQSCEVRSQ
jgi:hypothetical protein